MNRLSLPMTVTPPPVTVPRFIVVNSRNTLRSPISRRVGSPLYLRSCGASPIEANWKILLPEPRARADTHAIADHGVRTHRDIRGQLGLGRNDRAWVDLGHLTGTFAVL